MTIEDFATLADQLATLYPTIDDSRYIITTAGFQVVAIEFSNRPRDNWWNILQSAAYQAGALRSLLEKVIHDRPENKLIPVILSEIIIAEQKTSEPASLRQRVVRGFKKFRKVSPPSPDARELFADEKVSELELFHRMMEVSNAVGLMKSGQGTAASAILLNDGYVLTFHFPDIESNFEQHALFLEDRASPDGTRQLIGAALDPSFIHSNHKLYYTLLRRKPDDPFFNVRVPITTAQHIEGEEIRLISHPLGLEKRISGGKVIRAEDARIIYTSDSAPGSAGGPVIYKDKVIAMHQGRLPAENGQTLKYGIRIDEILLDAGLEIQKFTKE